MAGLLIVYLLVLNSDEGALILDEAFGKERCGAYIHVLELLLMVENFCKQESHELLQLKIIKTGIPYIMNTIKEVLDRKDGQGWKIPKFHLMTHFADDVYRFGSMRNFDSATGERNHKTEVKDPAQHTQRRKDEFEMQTADRYYENLLIQLAGTDLGLTGYWDKKIATEKEDNVDKCQNIYYCHEHKNLFKHKDRRLQPCDWKDETFKKQLIELCYALVQTGHLNSPIRFFTQHNRKSNIFRGDPDYKGFPWYDWAYVDWDGYDEPVPAKIWLFMDLHDNLNDSFWVGSSHIREKTSYAISHTFEDAAGEKAHGISLLVDFGEIMTKQNHINSPELCLFCLDSINAPCISVPYRTVDNIITAKKWMILASREKWYNILLNHLTEYFRKESIRMKQLTK